TPATTPPTPAAPKAALGSAPVPRPTAPPPQAGGTGSTGASQVLFEKARKRVTQRLTLAGMASGTPSKNLAPQSRLPAANAESSHIPAAPPVPEEVSEQALLIPASALLKIMPAQC